MQIKRIISLLMAIILSLSLAACGSKQAADKSSDAASQQMGSSQVTDNTEERRTEESEANDNTMPEEPGKEGIGAEGNKILVLYFSANNSKDVDAVSSATPMTGGTSSVEWIANIIHDAVGGDLIPIIPSVDYPLDYDALANYAKQERDEAGRPAFEDMGVDPASYDVVFIGYPIWWDEMPMIMDTFFDTYDFTGVTIIPFNTHAGSRDGGIYNAIKELEPNATVLDGLALRGEDVGKGSAKASVEEWLRGLPLE